MDTICEERERTEGELDSMVVYDTLIGEGENVPLSEMEEFMYELVARDLICGTIHQAARSIWGMCESRISPPTCAVRRQAKDQKAGK